MSRFKRFTHSLATGYLVLGVTVLQTLASVPLALHYLSKEEFGLWALVLQVAGYLALIDLGMSNSVSRILVDHKDDTRSGAYGSIIKTGALVLAVQGAIIALGGAALSYWLPDLLAVPQGYAPQFRILAAVQCVTLGVFFAGRVFYHILQAHQRYDLCNYASIASVLTSLAVMWLGLARGMGLYSLLAGSVASSIVANLFGWAAVARLKFFPPPEARGAASRKTFHELFTYGRRIFLITVGQQLISASQVIVISRTLGLNAAAVWTIATKAFMVAQQVVNRPFDFSAAAFSEMMVRGERVRILARFRDLVVLTVCLAIWAGLAVALCNASFLFLWTKGMINWRGSSDWLMAVLLIVNSGTRAYMGFTTLTKEIRAMPCVYLAEGVSFVLLSFLVAPVFGMNGIIISAIATNLFCTGIYGIVRAKEYFSLPTAKIMFGWLASPAAYFCAQTLLFVALWYLTLRWNPFARLLLDGAFAAFVGMALFWRVGLSPELRAESMGLLRKLRGRKDPPVTEGAAG